MFSAGQVMTEQMFSYFCKKTPRLRSENLWHLFFAFPISAIHQNDNILGRPSLISPVSPIPIEY